LSLYRLKLTADRLHVDTSADPRLADKVADNLFRQQKFEGTESETLVIGRGFGTTPDIAQGPDGSLYLATSNHDGRGDPAEGDDRIIRVAPGT
jgi:glucose/arabinose dehydrogenase